MQPIDSHVHAFSPSQARSRAALVERDAAFGEMYGPPGARMASFEDVARDLPAAGFAGAVIAGFAFAAEHDCAELNDYLLGSRLPGFVVLATVNPARAGWERTATAALAAGAAGFGELRPGNQGWDPLGPDGERLCALADEAGAVLLWHVSEPVGHRYPGKAGGVSPWDLCSLAARFPNLRQVAAHLGGGLPFFLQMPEVAAALQNTWFDTAATSLLYDDGAVARVVDLAGPDRVLFGSDYPLLAPRRHLERVLAAIEPRHGGAVCGGNVRHLFGGPWKG